METPVQEPTIDQVTEWVKKDLVAAHYFLGLLLRYPEIMERTAKDIMEHVKMKENGAAVDSIGKEVKNGIS